MARSVAARPQRRTLLGDLRTMELHDLSNEKPRCRLDLVLAEGYAVTFSPDSLRQAHTEGFTDCPYCLGRDNDSLI